MSNYVRDRISTMRHQEQKFIGVSPYYEEFRKYLDETDATQTIARKLVEIINTRFQGYSSDTPFSILDVGASDGELTMLVTHAAQERFRNAQAVALEPEEEAFVRLREKTNLTENISASNKTLQSFLQEYKDESELFDCVVLSHCWYHFPKSEWEEIMNGIRALLKPGGVATIVMDSHMGDAYALKDIITNRKEDILTFGYLSSAEDIEAFLSAQGVAHTTTSFPLYMRIPVNDTSLAVCVRRLAFLYRTFPEKLLTLYQDEIAQFLASHKKNGEYTVPNMTKVIMVKKENHLSPSPSNHCALQR